VQPIEDKTVCAYAQRLKEYLATAPINQHKVIRAIIKALANKKVYGLGFKERTIYLMEKSGASEYLVKRVIKEIRNGRLHD